MTRRRGLGAGAAPPSAWSCALDQVDEALAIARHRPGESDNVFFGLDLTNVRNTGVAFGALAGGGGWSWSLIGARAGRAARLLRHATRQRRGCGCRSGMLLGGALGNLADRARDGAVIDFIDPSCWPAFNLADVAIVVGVLGLLYVAEGTP